MQLIAVLRTLGAGNFQKENPLMPALMDTNRILALYFLFAAFAVGCKPQRSSSSVETEMTTSVFYADFHLQHVVYHVSDDSSEIFMRFPSSYLAAKKLNGEDGFKAIQLTLMVVDSTQSIIDTIRNTYFGQRLLQNTWLVMRERVSVPKGQYKIIVEIEDQNRSNISKEVLLVDKRNRYTDQNFLFRDSNGEVIFERLLAAQSVFHIESVRNNDLDSMDVWQFNADTKLPPPPFSNNAVEQPDFKMGSKSTISFKQGMATFNQMGLYQLLRIPGKTSGIIVRKNSHNYPLVDEANQLFPPLRYITTKGEYEEMSKSSYAKPLVDAFWLESGATKERARELIRIYYTRVEEANRYFTTYTEGWRTDRGMIYLVFGPPIELEISESQEKWHYGSADDESEIVFTFNKLNNTLGMPHFQLKRDPYFKLQWENMVNAWRNGRIRN
jgi:GWxTD domain-containing protein